MATPISTTEFSNHVFPSLRYLLVDEGYKEHAAFWPLIVETEETDLLYEDIAMEASFGMLGLKPQGGPIGYDLPKQGSTKRFTNSTYALGFPITLEDQMFNQYRKIGSYALSLGQSARETKEVNIWDYLGLGDTSTTIANGEAVFLATHALLKSSDTVTNYQNSTLGVGAIQQALSDIATTKDHRGFFAHLLPKYLHVHPSNYLLACEILNSVGRSDTGDRADNALLGILEPKADPYIATTTDWFIQCEKHFFKLFQHIAFMTDYGWDFKTKDYLVSVLEGYSYEFVDFMGWYMGYA